jgi:ABC-type nitrate/sulfonate/bicarbonate transport system substrate-binding protein
MNRLLYVVLTLCAAAASMAEAGDLRIDSASPAATVVRHFGWLEAGIAGRGTTVQWAADGKLDFASADGAAALKARAAGGALKAVYVLWRDAAGNDQYLLASEELLSKNASEAQAVIAAFERARRWITANPDEAAKVLAPGALMRNLTGSRPGPAQLAALGSTAKALGIDQKIAAQLLDDSLVRAVIVGAVRTPAEGGLNW